MKELFVIPFLVFLTYQNSLAQRVPYYDAIYLKTLASANGGRFKLSAENRELITFYFGTGLTDLQLDALITTNPLLAPYYNSPGAQAIPVGSNLPTAISSLGSLDITTLADGFAKFLVKRTKQELSAAFFSKFKDLITKPEYKDAQLLFPQTYSVLLAIGSEIYNYEAYLNGLREAFEKDLNSLLPNLKTVVEDGRYSTFFTAHPELKALCLSSIYVAEGLMNRVHPGEIIAEYPFEYLSDAKLINAKGVLQTLRLISKSIRSNGTARYWITSDELKLLLQDQVALNIYFGLIYQQAKNDDIQFSGSTKLHEIIANGVTERNAVVSYLKELQKHAAIVTSNIDNIKGKEKDKLTFENYFNLYNSSLDLMEHATTLYKVPGLESLKPDDKLKSQIHAARAGGNIALDINRRNYASAIINLFQLYNASITDPLAEKIKPFILKYGSFMAAVTQAENSDEVAQAIEAAALPSGSSRIKRETEFNVSLNSYVGLFSGYEKIEGADRSGFKFNSYGVTAPIGVSISRGHSVLFLGTGKKGWSEGKKGWSTSLFLSVVDIGALAAFRFANDTTETVPNIQLKDIISPGAFISIGIPKSPLSINFGYQVGPLLRKVTANVNEYKENYSRLSISLCVDIPILNFYSSPRKER